MCIHGADDNAASSHKPCTYNTSRIAPTPAHVHSLHLLCLSRNVDLTSQQRSLQKLQMMHITSTPPPPPIIKLKLGTPYCACLAALLVIKMEPLSPCPMRKLSSTYVVSTHPCNARHAASHADRQ